MCLQFGGPASRHSNQLPSIQYPSGASSGGCTTIATSLDASEMSFSNNSQRDGKQFSPQSAMLSHSCTSASQSSMKVLSTLYSCDDEEEKSGLSQKDLNDSDSPQGQSKVHPSKFRDDTECFFPVDDA